MPLSGNSDASPARKGTDSQACRSTNPVKAAVDPVIMVPQAPAVEPQRV